MRLFVLLSLAGLSMALPNPQHNVDAADVFGSDSNSARYGQDSGAVSEDLVDELFGGANNGHSNVQSSVNNGDYSEPEQQNSINDGYVAPEKQVVDTTSNKCSAYATQGYQCVPYYQCDELGEIITDGGPGLIDIRGNFGTNVVVDPENSKCDGYLEVCCRHPDFTAAVTTTTTTPKPVPYTSRCGTHNANGIGVRIQNDPYYATTQFGEWPHMCAILEDKDDKNLYVCGGSLIAPDVVLTAAHCVE